MNALKQVLDDSSLLVKSSAALSLARLGYADGSGIAIEFLQSPQYKHMGVRRTAVDVLRLLKQRYTRHILEDALSYDPDMWVRAKSAEALGEIGDTASTEVLMQALQDFAASTAFLTGPDWWAEERYPVAEAALGALLKIHPDEKQRLLVMFELARLEKGNWWAKEEASQKLAHLGAASVYWVAEALTTPEASLAFDIRLVDLLTRIGPAAVDPVMNALLEMPTSRAWLLARSLGEIGGSRAVPILKQLHEGSGDDRVRYEAERALQIIGE